MGRASKLRESVAPAGQRSILLGIALGRGLWSPLRPDRGAQVGDLGAVRAPRRQRPVSAPLPCLALGWLLPGSALVLGPVVPVWPLTTGLACRLQGPGPGQAWLEAPASLSS